MLPLHSLCAILSLLIPSPLSVLSFSAELDALLGIESPAESFQVRAKVLQKEMIGDTTVFTMNAPTIGTVDGVKGVRTGSTEFERDARSRPLDGCPRAIPVSLSVEQPKGGLHSPCLGNKYRGDEDLEDPGFKVRRSFMAVSWTNFHSCSFLLIFFVPAPCRDIEPRSRVWSRSIGQSLSQLGQSRECPENRSSF